MRSARWVATITVALVVVAALLPVSSAPECVSYGDDVTGCQSLARSIVAFRVWDGVLGTAIAVVAGAAAAALSGGTQQAAPVTR